ncbi:thylakoid membrane protein TERC, chloroplastic isoform X2 [Carica papaya]|uniref:thylakoid membrane protein TERC, chloroplastic isoform X2 n=1 Tax=Carica papaya TaxID=3649 RepID=UPI000B8CFABE|nr:thylakoid membrane protein TERC, chloroplastic isoform X2 [Carica papaya]
MELTSVIHSGIKAPIKLDQVLLSISPISLSKRTKLHFSHLHNPTLSAVRSGRCRQVSPLGCSKGTEQEDVSASDCERTGSQSLIDIDNVSTSDTQYSVDSHGTKAEEQEIYSSSMRTVALWVSTAVAFGVGIGLKDGIGKASEFFAGYILEQSLSVDNLFVFVLVFKYFKVPLMYQSQVLSYGFAGAIIFRLSIILLGTATLQRFEAVNLVLAVILLFSSFKATPLLLTVAVIELSDIAFAVDSIPAVFGVTRDPFIVFTSNLFAILGLRSLYTLISEGMADLEYLQPSIGIVLGFIGCKMILDFFGFHVSTEASLGFVATSLTAGVLLSLMNKSDS